MKTIFDLMKEFNYEEEDKKQRYVHVDPENVSKALDLFLGKLDQPLNCVANTTILEPDDETKEKEVVKFGFKSTGERYGEIKAKMEFAGLLSDGKVKEKKKK